MDKKMILLYLGLSAYINLYAQYDSSAHAANFKKINIVDEEFGLRILDDSVIADNYYAYLTVDADNKIVKYFSYDGDPDYCKCIISHYDEKGQLTSLIYRLEDFDKGLYGTISVKEPDKIQCSMIVRKEDPPSLDTIVAACHHFPDSAGQLPIKCFVHTDSILKHLTPHNIPLSAGIPVTIVSPDKGDKTYTNANRTVVYEQPSTDSNVIMELLAGYPVMITGIAGKEKIWNEEHNWYEVLFDYGKNNGYIFGAFLEPVEREIKE